MTCQRFGDATVISQLYSHFLRVGEMFANGCLEVILPEAMQHQHLFHVLVALARSVQLVAQQRPPVEDAVVLSHRGQALASIQASISAHRRD